MARHEEATQPEVKQPLATQQQTSQQKPPAVCCSHTLRHAAPHSSTEAQGNSTRVTGTYDDDEEHQVRSASSQLLYPCIALHAVALDVAAAVHVSAGVDAHGSDGSLDAMQVHSTQLLSVNDASMQLLSMQLLSMNDVSHSMDDASHSDSSLDASGALEALAAGEVQTTAAAEEETEGTGEDVAEAKGEGEGGAEAATTGEGGGEGEGEERVAGDRAGEGAEGIGQEKDLDALEHVLTRNCLQLPPVRTLNAYINTCMWCNIFM